MLGKSHFNYFRFFFYASAFWVAVGVLHLGTFYVEELLAAGPPPSAEQWVLFILVYLTWAFITTFIYFLVEKLPPSKENFWWVFWLVIVAMMWLVMVAIIRQCLASLLWDTSQVEILTLIINEPPFLYLFNLLKIFMIYGVCAGIFYYSRMKDAQLTLLNLQREAAEALEKQTRMQLQVLQSQLSPHFLFNSLNSISGLSRNNDSGRVVQAVAHLADILRYALEGASKKQVLVDDELVFTKSYIFLQTLRFEGCFNYFVSMDVSDRFAFCPPFCIQTLVENVFAHNDLSQQNTIAIQVDVKQESGSLIIEVENSPLIPVKNTGAGIGLDNLRGRLKLIYGDHAQLSILENHEKFLVTLIFPVTQEND